MFKERNYKVQMCVGNSSNILRKRVSAFSTGTGPILPCRFFLGVK